MTQEAKERGRIQPNDALKQERQRRGWSRGYIAEQIGIADPKTIGRWERGAASPSAYFLQRLCHLFDMLPHELGLLQDNIASSSALPAKQPSAIHPGDHHVDIAAPIFDPLIPPPHVETDGLVARDAVLYQLKERLCSGKGRVQMALYGLPGVGKTALAAELAYDGEVQQHFRDGILWAAPGPEANAQAHLERWGNLLGLAEVEMQRFTTIEMWIHCIRAAIGMRQMLIIIDDVWTTESAFAFNVGGPNCSYLLTTRLPTIALHFANANAFHVRAWDEEEGLQLLARFAPKLVAQDEPTARRLVRAVGGLPLGITIVGKYCRDHSYGGQQRRLYAALERLNASEERLRLTMYQVRPSLEQREGRSECLLISMEMAIATSYQRLDERAQYMLSQLAVFPTGQDGFSEEAALAVSALPIETLDALVDAGLLEVIESGRYILHPTIADYARIQHDLTAARKRMVAYFVRYVETYAMDSRALTAEQHNIQEALGMAFALSMSSTTLQEVFAFASALQARGHPEQAAWCLQQVERAVRQANRRSVWPVGALHVESRLFSAREHIPIVLMQAYQAYDNRLAAPLTARKRRPHLLTGPPS
jgi:transcriptional regulator with XRE-family HTH domain